MRRLLRSGALLSFLIATGCGGDDPKDDGLSDGNTLNSSNVGPAGEQGAAGPAGTQGTAGPAGEQGPAGAEGPGLSSPFTGTVTGPSGPIAGANVLLWLRTQYGEDSGMIAAAQTGADGRYTMRVPNFSSPSSTLMLTVETEDEEGEDLRAILSGQQTNINVASTIIASWIGNIVDDDGLSLSEFTPAEVATLVSGADAALVADATDLTDEEAAFTTVMAALEPEFATAASANFSIAVPVNPVTAVPTDTKTDITSFNVTLVDGASESWDIQDDGTIYSGTNDAFDTMFELAVDHTPFPAMTAGTATAQLEDGREVVLGPVANLAGTGLTVTRKIYVSDTLGYARFLEVFSNPGATDLSTEVQIEGELGSSSNYEAASASSSGDTWVDSDDTWFTDHQDASAPALGFLYPGAEAYKDSEYVRYYYPTLMVPAGRTVSLVHWAFQKTGTQPAAVTALTGLLQSLPAVPPASYWAGMTNAEAASTLLLTPTLSATAGAVAPYSLVMMTVNPDGSGGFDSQFVAWSTEEGTLSTPVFSNSAVTAVQVTTDNGTNVTLRP